MDNRMYVLRVVLLLLCCQLVLAKGSVSQPKAASVAFAKAKATQQVYPMIEGKYIFFLATCDYEEEASDEDREMAQMDAQFKALETYVSKGVNEQRLKHSPFSQKMSKVLMPFYPLQLPTLAMTTVEEVNTKQHYRQIFACDIADIKTLQAKLMAEADGVKNWTDRQWAQMLALNFKLMATEKDRRYFLTMLGCPLIPYLSEREIRVAGMDLDEQSRKGWQEIKTMLQWSVRSHEDFPTADLSELWGWVWATKGQVSLGGGSSKDHGEFKEGKKLYHLGKDIPRIIYCLAKSLSLGPNNREGWRYLGGILQVKKYYHEAMVAYLQVAYFASLSLEELKTVQALCTTCNMPVNARGMQWYLLMMKELTAKDSQKK